MKVELFDHNGSDRHIAAYFWTSTDKDADAFTCPESEVERVLRFGMKAQPVPHATPFGHPSITFHVENIPMAIGEQWLRHRVQNFSKKSLRYVEAKPKFYTPDHDDVRKQIGRPGHYALARMEPDDAKWAATEMEIAYEEAYDSYLRLRDRGVADELSRFVLPAGLITSMYATTSLRNWFNFLVQRNDDRAQLEIRRCAEQVESILHTLYPITMRLWTEYGRRIV